MVDGISWNPFTNKPLTTEEIEKLDANKNGVVEESELTAGFSWLAGGQDAEGEVEIETGNELYGMSVAHGMKTTASSEEEFKNNMAILKDEFIEQYLNKNTGLSDAERTNILNLINTATNEFINGKLTTKAESYDMAAIAKDYQSYIDGAIAANKALLDSVNAQINSRVKSTDASYDAMLSSAKAADSNGHVTTSEWGPVRNSAVSYLMGALLDGQDVTALMSNIDPKFHKNSNYQEAVNAIAQLKNCNDPKEMQELLTKAQNALTAFLNSVGAAKVVDAINDTAKAKEEAAITAELNKVVDKWVEDQCNMAIGKNGVPLSSEEIAELKNFAQTAIGKFLDKLEKDGGMDSTNMKVITVDFEMFITTELNNYRAVKEDLKAEETEIETAYNSVIKTSDSAKANGNVYAEEKEAIVEAATGMVYQQLLADADVIPLLQALNPNYANMSQFKEIQSLITKIKASTDYEEINKLVAEVQEKIKKLLDSFSGEQLTVAVDRTKPVEIDSDMKADALYNSTIGNDYDAGVSRSTSRGKQNDDRLKEIQEMAKKDIAAYVESLKAQLKAQLGAGYDEAAIDEIVKSATNDTIDFFTQGIERKDQDGDYSTDTDNYRFVFADRSGTSKGRYCYNVKALIDKFTEFFNSAAKVYNEQKNDPTKITYDKEDVIADSLGNEYLRDERIKGNEVTVRAQAKTKLMSVAAQIQAQLAAKGCKVPSSTITMLLDESIQETLDILELKEQADYDCFVVKSGVDYHYVNTKEIVDDFLDIFEAKLAKEKGFESEEDKEKLKDEKPKENP